MKNNFKESKWIVVLAYHNKIIAIFALNQSLNLHNI